MGHDTKIVVWEFDADDKASLAIRLFEFSFKDRNPQRQLNGQSSLVIHRQSPPDIRGPIVHDVKTHGGYWEWGWCLPSELKKLRMEENAGDWVEGLLKVASVLSNSSHLIEFYDAG